MTILTTLKKLFKVEKKNQPFPEKEQVWSDMEPIVDQYCTPIVIKVDDVKDGKVFYSTNYGTKFEKDINLFMKDYTYQMTKRA